MSFMFRDRKDTDFAYSNSSEPPYTKSELESEIAISESIISDHQRKLDDFLKQLELDSVAEEQEYLSRVIVVTCQFCGNVSETTHFWCGELFPSVEYCFRYGGYAPVRCKYKVDSKGEFVHV